MFISGVKYLEKLSCRNFTLPHLRQKMGIISNCHCREEDHKKGSKHVFDRHAIILYEERAKVEDQRNNNEHDKLSYSVEKPGNYSTFDGQTKRGSH